MPSTPSHRRPKSLSSGRPKPSFATASTSKAHSSIAARHTRSTIRKHHTLHKQHAAALAASDHVLAASLSRQIEAAGGLTAYQHASRTGQSRERGGDASSVLVSWLREREYSAVRPGAGAGATGLRLLDVGALTCDTAASRSGLFERITRIDLESREKGVLQQDFMQRPLPESEEDKFDVISLSLVLNYVPEAKGRGDMLQRTCEFLHAMPGKADSTTSRQSMLFIVLPAPCLLNSRYLSMELFAEILASLGYSVIDTKTSSKLVYLLCTWNPSTQLSMKHFRKHEIRAGGERNNFAIVLG